MAVGLDVGWARNVQVVCVCFAVVTLLGAGLFKACAVLAESDRNVQQSLELIRT